jgi:Tfp pilus assembly protein PilN
MIRINLAKSQSFTPNTAANTATAIDLTQIGLNVGGTQFTKILAIVSVTLLILIYDMYATSVARAQLEVTSAQVQALELEITSYGEVDTVLEGLAKEKAKVNEQLVVIQNISKKRAFKVKTLMRLQESLPEDLWLNELKINNDQVVFVGYSRSPTSVQKIVKNLNEADFIQNAFNRELSRVKVGDEAIQKFEIEARMKN